MQRWVGSNSGTSSTAPPRRIHGICGAGRCRPSPLTRDHARLSPRPAAAQQGRAVSSRSTDCRGDHDCDARDWGPRRRVFGFARCSCCCGAPDCASAKRSLSRRLTADVALCSSAAGGAASDAKSGWTGGPGSKSTHGSRSEASFRSARSCVSSTDRPRGGAGRPPRHVGSVRATHRPLRHRPQRNAR